MKREHLAVSQLGEYQDVGQRFFPAADWANGILAYPHILARWPSGITLVRDEPGAIAGYLCLFPITARAFADFQSRTLADDDFTAAQMPPVVRTPHPFWLLRTIAVQPAPKEIRRAVITELLGELDRCVTTNRPCTIMAHASTPDGVRFLTRSGFSLTGGALPLLAVKRYD